MSGLQQVDPIAQRFIQGAAASGKDCSYCKRTRDFAGREVESVSIEVLEGVVHVVESSRRPFALGDWLQVVGGVAIVFVLAWMAVQGVKGVLKSEIDSGSLVQIIEEV